MYLENSKIGMTGYRNRIAAAILNEFSNAN